MPESLTPALPGDEVDQVLVDLADVLVGVKGLLRRAEAALEHTHGADALREELRTAVGQLSEFVATEEE